MKTVAGERGEEEREKLQAALSRGMYADEEYAREVPGRQTDSREIRIYLDSWTKCCSPSGIDAVFQVSQDFVSEFIDQFFFFDVGYLFMLDFLIKVDGIIAAL